jgi:hypothetical protein
MVSTGHSEPTDVVDRLLWRSAQTMLDRHASPDDDGKCVWCGSQWPCPPRQLAQRAEAASRQPGEEAWTGRHGLNGLHVLPSWHDSEGSGNWGPTNGGSFD